MESNYPHRSNHEFNAEYHEEATETDIRRTFETIRSALIDGAKGYPMPLSDEGEYVFISRKLEKNELDSAGWREWMNGRLITYEGIDHDTDQVRETVEMVLESPIMPMDDKAPIVVDIKRIRLHHYRGGDLAETYDYDIKRLQRVNGEPAERSYEEPAYRAEQIIHSELLSHQIDKLPRGEVRAMLSLIPKL